MGNRDIVRKPQHVTAEGCSEVPGMEDHGLRKRGSSEKSEAENEGGVG